MEQMSERDTMDRLQAVPRRLIVAIDGPAGAGKSTVAATLARRFGLLNLETGAMYRALALKALAIPVPLDDAAALTELCAKTSIALKPGEHGNLVLLDGADVTDHLRTPEVTSAASRVSVHASVRAWMVNEQRNMGLQATSGVVMEGRDIGTVVFPEATVKIFLDASVEARGDRRFLQVADTAAGSGDSSSKEVITREIADRDDRDRQRAASPLKPAEDAYVIDTTSMSLEAVLARAADLVQRAQNHLAPAA